VETFLYPIVLRKNYRGVKVVLKIPLTEDERKAFVAHYLAMNVEYIKKVLAENLPAAVSVSLEVSPAILPAVREETLVIRLSSETPAGRISDSLSIAVFTHPRGGIYCDLLDLSEVKSKVENWCNKFMSRVRKLAASPSGSPRRR
jgi:hypothetical protein